MSKTRHGPWPTYRRPLLLAMASFAGLTSALIGDGPYDLFSWITLGGLVVVIAAMLRR